MRVGRLLSYAGFTAIILWRPLSGGVPVGFALLALLPAAFVVMSLRDGITTTDDGVSIRNGWSTREWQWSEIARFSIVDGRLVLGSYRRRLLCIELKDGRGILRRDISQGPNAGSGPAVKQTWLEATVDRLNLLLRLHEIRVEGMPPPA